MATLAEFRASKFGPEFPVASFPDALVSDALKESSELYLGKSTRALVYLAQHILALDADDASTVAGGAVDLGSGAGLIREEYQDSRRAIYTTVVDGDDGWEASYGTSKYGRAFLRTYKAKGRQQPWVIPTNTASSRRSVSI